MGFVTYFRENTLNLVCFQMCVVIAAIFSVILYRIVVVALLYTVEPNETIAKLGTSISASIINLIIILVLNQVSSMESF